MKRGTLSRHTPLRRKARLAIKRITKRKPSIWAQYGLTKPKYVRYSGRKGVYWWLFSRKIRQRDYQLYGGLCVDLCGNRASSWQELQAGHFVPAGQCGFGLLFDEQNVNGQLPACNNPRISPMAPIGYSRGLDMRYGEGTADKLMARRHTISKEWSQAEYDRRIRSLLDTMV